MDEEKLNNLTRRRNTYGDICQGFSEDQLRKALADAGNDVPTAIELLQQTREQEGHHVLVPPKFLDNSQQVHETHAIEMDSQPVLLGRTK